MSIYVKRNTKRKLEEKSADARVSSERSQNGFLLFRLSQSALAETRQKGRERTRILGLVIVNYP